MKKGDLLLSALLLLSATTAVQAQLNTTYFKQLASERVTSTPSLVWQQFGPGMAGYCEELWCHPTDVNTLLMGPDMHVSYGSWDNGNSWQSIKDCDGTGYDMERVIEVAFSHQDPDYALAIDREGNVCRSTNRGRSWSVITDLGKTHSELTVDPSNDNNWYIGAGDFFNVKENHRSLANPHGLILSRSDYGWIWRSTDRGNTWQKVTKGLPDKVDVGKIVVDPRHSNRLLAVTGHGLYRSTDSGESWNLAGGDLPNNLPRDITSYYDVQSGEYILYLVEQSVYEPSGSSLSVKGGVFKSTDGGESWQDVTGNLAIDLTQISSYTVQSQYYRAVNYWLGISNAKQRYPQLPKQIYSVFNRIRVNPNDKNEVYLTHNIKHDFAFGPADVWKTSDGGKSWIASARMGSYWSGNKNSDYWRGRNNPLGENTHFAHLAPTFVQSESSVGNRFLEINVEGDVFICIDQQTLRSNDEGDSWQQADDIESAQGSNCWIGRGGSNMPGRFMLLETGIKERMLLCSGEHGLWQNVPLPNYPNKGAIAVKQLEGQVNSGGAHSIATVAVHPQDPNTIYMLMFRQNHRDYLRRSTDGGKSWVNIAKPIANFNPPNNWGYHMFQYSLIIDPDNPNNLYFNSILNPISEVGDGSKLADYNDYGVYKSSDGGYNWQLIRNGLTEKQSIHRICIDPANSATLYAASNAYNMDNGGLYRSKDHGESWARVAIPSSIVSVNNVFVDRNNGYIYLSCGTKSCKPERGGVWRSKDQCKTWEKIFDLPYIWQTETSPIDPNIITVSAAGRKYWGSTVGVINPGAYISFDGGKSWIKANKGLGQPDKITDLKPDPYNKNLFWCALWGSGWYRGEWKNPISVEVKF